MDKFTELLELLVFLKAETVAITHNSCYGISSQGSASLPIGAEELGIKPMSVLVNDLYNFIKGKDYNLSIKDNLLIVKAGKAKAEFSTFDSSCIDLKTGNFTKKISVSKEICKAISICDKNDARIYTHGTGYSNGMMAVSNGIALVFSKCESAFENIIPSHALQIADKYNTDVEISEDNQICLIQCGDVAVICGMIVATFPSFERALPDSINHSVSVPGKELKEALSTAMSFSDNNKVIKLRFSGETLYLETGLEGKKKFTTEIECSRTQELEISLSIHNLIKLVSLYEEVDFQIKDVNLPIKIGAYSVIVPMRI